MAVYISLLRGINVSGQKKIRMEELKALYQDLGYTRVSTYIQSGNVVFRASDEVRAETIEKAIAEQFDFEVPVLLRGMDELTGILMNNPFLKRPSMDESKLHVVFLNTLPDAAAQSSLKQIQSDEDECHILGKQVYLYCPNGYGRSKFTNTNIEKRLSLMATTRNWKTVNQLHQLASQVADA